MCILALCGKEAVVQHVCLQSMCTEGQPSNCTFTLQAADTAAPYVKKGVDVASPYVKAGANLAQEAAKPVIKAAGPIVQVKHHQHCCQ